MDRWTEKQKREAAAYQFELQAGKLYLSVQQRLPGYRYLVKDEIEDRELTALVLACT
jgi:hypothetical protein